MFIIVFAASAVRIAVSIENIVYTYDSCSLKSGVTEETWRCTLLAVLSAVGCRSYETEATLLTATTVAIIARVTAKLTITFLQLLWQCLLSG